MRQYRGIVDPIPHHSHDAFLGLELFDLTGLFLGEHLGEDTVNTDLSCMAVAVRYPQ
jgi:hypothetical protein